jgi:hypothetical protein
MNTHTILPGKLEAILGVVPSKQGGRSVNTNEKPIGYREVQHNGRMIVSGFTAYSFWAKYGDIYEGGYRSQKSATGAVKRRLDRRDKEAA